MLVKCEELIKKIEEIFKFDFKKIKLIGNLDNIYDREFNELIYKQNDNIYIFDVYNNEIMSIELVKNNCNDYDDNFYLNNNSFTFKNSTYHYKSNLKALFYGKYNNNDVVLVEIVKNNSTVEHKYFSDKKIKIPIEDTILIKLSGYFLDEKELMENKNVSKGS